VTVAQYFGWVLATVGVGFAQAADRGDAQTQAWRAYSVCVAASLQRQLVDIARSPKGPSSLPSGSTLVTKARQTCSAFRDALISTAGSSAQGMNSFQRTESVLVEAFERIADNALLK